MVGAAGILLSFAGSVVIALPLFRKSEVENLRKHVQLDEANRSRYDGADPDDWLSHPVWKSFQAQRRYAQIGLTILGLGIALQTVSIYFQAVLG
jgi:hypothetical protein